MLNDPHPGRPRLRRSRKRCKIAGGRPPGNRTRTTPQLPSTFRTPLFGRIEDEREVAHRFTPVRGDRRHAEQVHGEDLPREHEALRAQETAKQDDKQAEDPGYGGSRGGDQEPFARRNPREPCTTYINAPTLTV